MIVHGDHGVLTERAEEVLEIAGPFLGSRPVVHNLVPSLLRDRVAHPRPGRYWVVDDDHDTVGVVFQSPLDFLATITPMPDEAVAAAVSAVAAAGVRLPGVNGEAATAARFAGQWTELHKTAAEPVQGQRIYELDQIVERPPPPGRLRNADAADRGLILAWMRGFDADTGERASDVEGALDRRLAAGQYWLWDDAEPLSMAAHTRPIQGVVRIQAVYTPPPNRRRGYAGACIGALSAQLHDAGNRCILYTDLANPVSNSVYRRIGYQAVVECLRYQFS